MALSDKITGQFRPRPPTPPQRPYLPTIVRDAEPTRPPIAQPPPQRTPMPPPYRTEDERAQWSQNVADQARARGWVPKSFATPTPPPDAVEQARQRAYEWSERAGDIVPPAVWLERQEQRQARMRPTPDPRADIVSHDWLDVYQREIPSAQTFAQRVQRQADLSPNVDWNKYPVFYEPMLLNENIGGQYNPVYQQIEMAYPSSSTLLHEYAHAYDLDRNADPFSDVSSQPAFTRDYQTTIRLPWLFAEQHPTYDQNWYRQQVDALVKNVPYQGDPAEMYARLAPRYAQSPYNVPAQLRPYIAPMFRDQPLPPPPYPYPRPAPTPAPPSPYRPR